MAAPKNSVKFLSTNYCCPFSSYFYLVPQVPRSVDMMRDLFQREKRCLSSHKNRGATSNFSLGQPQRIYCIFCSFQTTFFTKKLQTSAGFELGLLELKASTLTTRPPPQTYLQNCFEKCALLKVPFRHSAIFNSLKKISKVLTILSKRMKDYFTNSVTRFGENFATLAKL